ncbi:MAG: RHS repeat-associated core domain-containing protein [bacterium]|nr:RHS repeat-associated core domain-containing protein [bacterium]
MIKKSYPNTSDSTIYIYEGGEVVLEMNYDQIPENKHLFTYAGGKKVSRTDFNSDGSININSRKYFHQNFLGSIAMITDVNGNIEEHNKYEPFGDIIWSESYIDTDNNYKFTGKERDKESNLDYFNARYLDTKLGRFIKADVLWGNIYNPQCLNRYVYCINNPIKYLDKEGLKPNIEISQEDLTKKIEQYKSAESFVEILDIISKEEDFSLKGDVLRDTLTEQDIEPHKMLKELVEQVVLIEKTGQDITINSKEEIRTQLFKPNEKGELKPTDLYFVASKNLFFKLNINKKESKATLNFTSKKYLKLQLKETIFTAAIKEVTIKSITEEGKKCLDINVDFYGLASFAEKVFPIRIEIDKPKEEKKNEE